MEHDEHIGCEPEQTPPDSGQNDVQDARERTRRNTLHLASGTYLLYLTYRLGSDFFTQIGEKGWTGSMVISLIGAVVFLLTGSFLLVSCLKRMWREYQNDKNSKKKP